MKTTTKIRATFIIIAISLGVILGGCAQLRIGKVDLTDGRYPHFLKTGQTTVKDVLEQIGEPLGYRRAGNRSAMIYVSYHEDYAYLLVTEIRVEKAYRLDLVFNNDVLEKVEVRREGWGLGANVDPQLLQLLAR